jgi:hypothetical protein
MLASTSARAWELLETAADSVEEVFPAFCQIVKSARIM